MRKKMKRTTKQYIIVAIICIIVMGGAAVTTALMITGQIKDKYASLLDKANQEMNENKHTVYIAVNEISAGDYITEENAEMQTVYSTQPIDAYITSEDMGKVALINIMSGTQVLKSMLSDKMISSELRELEYTVIYVSSNVANNDYVDVRISYPNGESYVILSKKLMKGFLPETSTCYLWLDEKELLRMSAAIVDAGLYNGSRLYVTKYIEPNIQEASVVNYIPSLSILSLLESDPNIIERASQELSRELRKSLENRLADSMETDVSQISWDTNPNVLAVTPFPKQEELVTETLPDPNQESQNTDNVTTDDGSELGSNAGTGDYFYYAEEEQAKESDIEYGE
ncbi:MAG TPA: SAF domain-containing protein [Mobilitalea sp.]|nr:SAF domain-containing protein [Mobilitalea sp.]